MSDVIQNVVGSDGINPIYNPEARWCWWGLHEIWLGQEGKNRYVPKVNDYVCDYTKFATYVVDYVDPVTLIPTLRAINPFTGNTAFSENDILFGVGPGTQSDTYRVYVDKSVVPAVMAVDSRLKVGGSMASYAKIFKGSDLATSGKVISKTYDANGVFVSENIPLEIVAIDNHINYSIRTVGVCHVTEELTDGEVVTAVIYSDNGHVLSKRQLLVENTSFIRSLNASKKHVVSISLDCPFKSLTSDGVIEFPLNIPINSLNLVGIVNYNDGSKLELPVDGTKFSIHGLSQFVSSIVGQRIKLVLSYALGTDETSTVGVSSDGKYVTENYELATVNPNNSYTVKLFGYPVWQSEALGYTMKWWLFNLDRNVSFDVTPFVNFNGATGAFNPKGYGVLQRKEVSINLNDVSGAYKPFIHTQVVDIVLYQPSLDETPWTVSHEAIDTIPVYGNNLRAQIKYGNKITVDAGIETKEAWLEQVYNRTYPLIEKRSAVAPLVPTHFVLQADGLSVEYLIDYWNQELTTPFSLVDKKLLGIKFIRRLAANDLQLSQAAMMMVG